MPPRLLSKVWGFEDCCTAGNWSGRQWGDSGTDFGFARLTPLLSNHTRHVQQKLLHLRRHLAPCSLFLSETVDPVEKRQQITACDGCVHVEILPSRRLVGVHDGTNKAYEGIKPQTSGNLEFAVA